MPDGFPALQFPILLGHVSNQYWAPLEFSLRVISEVHKGRDYLSVHV